MRHILRGSVALLTVAGVCAPGTCAAARTSNSPVVINVDSSNPVAGGNQYIAGRDNNVGAASGSGGGAVGGGQSGFVVAVTGLPAGELAGVAATGATITPVSYTAGRGSLRTTLLASNAALASPAQSPTDFTIIGLICSTNGSASASVSDGRTTPLPSGAQVTLTISGGAPVPLTDTPTVVSGVPACQS
jgi:hypothetical protein